MECVFCKIVAGELPSKKVFENEWVLAFENIKPVHPVHVEIIPKKHIDNPQSITEGDKEYAAQMMLAVPEVARIKGVGQSGYRLIINHGQDSGRTVEHLHMHLVGGEPLPFATG